MPNMLEVWLGCNDNNLNKVDIVVNLSIAVTNQQACFYTSNGKG